MLRPSLIANSNLITLIFLLQLHLMAQ